MHRSGQRAAQVAVYRNRRRLNTDMGKSASLVVRRRCQPIDPEKRA
jgi:hypothetical protein